MTSKGIPDVWGFQVEVSFRCGSDFAKHLFNVKGGITRGHGGVACWWPHGEIEVLGLSVGAGFIWKFNHSVKLPDETGGESMP